jgi:hypothetical protein
MKHSLFLTFSPFCPRLKCKAILPTFPFSYGSSLLTKNYIGIAQKVESDWGRPVASSWYLPSSFHLPFGLEPFPLGTLLALKSKQTLWWGHRCIHNQHIPAAAVGSVTEVKPKVQPRTGHEGPQGEWRYSSTLSLTSALDGLVALGGLVVSVLATGPKVRGFDPDRCRWIFNGDKNPEHHFLRRGSKAVGPMS